MKTATYYSPSGNPEIWEEGRQPAGYVTPEEWQAAHPAPEPEPLTPEQQAEMRRQEILTELDRIDRASARSARAVAVALLTGAEPDPQDAAMLRQHENEAVALREELAELNTNA